MVKVKFRDRFNSANDFYGPSFNNEVELKKWFLNGIAYGSQFTIYVIFDDGTCKPIEQVMGDLF